jgi:hypothetical protein
MSPFPYIPCAVHISITDQVVGLESKRSLDGAAYESTSEISSFSVVAVSRSMSENHRILPRLEATVVLFLHSPLEPFSLLLRCRVELLVAPLQLTLPSMILAFDSFPLAFPV